MSIDSNQQTSGESARVRPLRTWPALALAAIMLITRFAPNVMEGGLAKYWMIALLGPLLSCLLLLIWWLAASRATWKERVIGLVGLIVSFGFVMLLIHPTMRGPGAAHLTLPLGMLAFALATVALARQDTQVPDRCRHLSGVCWLCLPRRFCATKG